MNRFAGVVWAVRRAVAGLVLRAFGYTPPTAPQPPATPPTTGAGGTAAKSKRKKRRSTPQPNARSRWLQGDVEAAGQMSASGDLSLAGQLYRAICSRDATIQGLLGTRTNGLVRLPKVFHGDLEAVAYLQGSEGRPGAFERIFPEAELALLDADGIVIGAGVGELLEQEDGSLRFARLDPEFLRYQWWDDAWYYESVRGLERINPGDGRWILHLPGGRQDPWNRGSLIGLGRAFVSKEHAFFYRENWNAKLAHPARVAYTPPASTERQRQGFLDKLLAWGVDTAFEMPPGWDAKLLESNGHGYESFKETIADANQEFMISIAGQVVTVTGGAGFANADIHATIRGDLIQGDGKTLGATISEQGLPAVLAGLPFGRATITWDTRPPVAVKDEAEALTAAVEAIAAAATQLKALGLPVDVLELAKRFGVPLQVAAQALPAELAGQPAANDTDAPLADDQDAPVAGDEAPDDSVSNLAQKMTAAGVSRCEHGRANRCPLCGIERVRDFDMGEDGAPTWHVAWRPIAIRQAA